MAVFLLPAYAQAQDIGLNYANEIGLVKNDKDVREVIVDIVKYLLTFVGIVALAVIIYGGFLWMTSAANPERLARAKKTVVNGVIGLVIIIFSYAIVVFIINLFNDGLGGPGNNTDKGDPWGRGIGAIGSCTVETVYPEPGQTDVPRNTSIIVTFTEPVNPQYICGATACNGTAIVAENIRLFKDAQGDSCEWDGAAWINCAASNLTNVLVTSSDARTWVFSPQEYLGSPSEHIKYRVYLSGAIRKADGKSIFATCRDTDFFSWDFTVSNRIDLEPPQVQSVFPPADSEQDDSADVPAEYATGSVRVLAAPAARSLATAGAPVNVAPGGIAAAVSGFNDRQAQAGTLIIDFTDDGRTARLENQATGVLLGSAASNAARNSVAFPGFLTLSLSDTAGQFADGNAWTVAVTAYAAGDTLRVGSVTYVFVASAPSGDEIAVGANNAATAQNIANKLTAGHPEVTGVASGDTVLVTALSAGTAGNGITLAAGDPAKFAITAMKGGRPAGEVLTPRDRPDQPRNAIIKVNFNEAMNPITISGAAADVWRAIAVKCAGGAACAGLQVFNCNGENCVAGRWLVSNVYRTAEFVPDFQCGVNSCGDPIFCLPPDSNIRVDIAAAALAACDNCAAKAPFSDCVGGHCHDAASGRNHPLSVLSPPGVMDAALNSLDGNRDGAAAGPLSHYDLNAPLPADGDSFRWSFWVTNAINAVPPRVLSINYDQGASDVPLDSAIEMNFNAVMMSSSLKTGSTAVSGPAGRVRHKNINLWNFANRPTGYWVAALDQDLVPAGGDGVPEWTKAEIRHTPFADSVSYRAQAGSGVRDIYQNCFNPSDGPACSGESAATPNCCSGAVVGPAGLNRDGNCN